MPETRSMRRTASSCVGKRTRTANSKAARPAAPNTASRAICAMLPSMAQTPKSDTSKNRPASPMISHRRGHRRSKSSAHLLARTFRLKTLLPGEREACGSGIWNDTGSAAEDAIKNKSDVHVKLLWQRGEIKGPSLLIRQPIRHTVHAD